MASSLASPAFKAFGSTSRPRVRGIQLAAPRASNFPHEGDMVDVERQLPLPNAIWLLDSLQAGYFDVRGQDFIIQRAESSFSGSLHPVKYNRTKRSQLSVRPPPTTPSMASLIVKAAQAQPMNLVTYNGYPVMDITECLTIDVDADGSGFEDVLEALEWNAETCAPAPTSQWGIVAVEQEEEEGWIHTEDREPDVYTTSSESPRRTHMVGFTCLCCGARCHNQVNPTSFHDGTLAAKCGKCQSWHKIKDRFNLFGYELKGDEFVSPSVVREELIPLSLRIPLDPFYWKEQDN